MGDNRDGLRDFKHAARQRLNLVRQACAKLRQVCAKRDRIDPPVDLLDIENKVDRSLARVDEHEFEISLFGAFSDGKSTVIAALTESLDVPIGVGPTTNDVRRYPYGEDRVLVDTPGAFSALPAHDAAARSYVSEADLVVFVVNAVNPLPKSQEQLVRWLLVEINKEPHVVFAINRMDEVADLEDDADFDHYADVKKRSLRETLQEICGRPCSSDVVAISADPYERGLDYWLDDVEYERLSRLPSLVAAIEKHLAEQSDRIQADAGFASVRDAIGTALERLEETCQQTRNYEGVLRQQSNELAREQKVLAESVHRAYKGIRDDVDVLRRDLLNELEGCSDRNSLTHLCMLEIGEHGTELKRKIEDILADHMHTLQGDAVATIDRLASTLQHSDGLIRDLLKRGGDALAAILRGASTRGTADAVIAIRNKLRVPFKFEPWGAVKFARALETLPVLWDIVSGVVEAVREHKLSTSRNTIKNEVDKALRGFRDSLSSEGVAQQVPALTKLDEMVEEQSVVLKDVEEVRLAMEEAMVDFRNLAPPP